MRSVVSLVVVCCLSYEVVCVLCFCWGGVCVLWNACSVSLCVVGLRVCSLMLVMRCLRCVVRRGILFAACCLCRVCVALRVCGLFVVLVIVRCCSWCAVRLLLFVCVFVVGCWLFVGVVGC